MFAYFGIDYLLGIALVWVVFAAAVGWIALLIVRRIFNPAAVWFEWGLLGALVGASVFLLLWGLRE